MYTNTILSEALNTPITKIRRWTKKFLPPDERATRRSGYTREFSLNEGFYIYLGGTMVEKFGWTFVKAREALKIIWPWMESIGMVPDIPATAKRRGIDTEIQQYNLVHFYTARMVSSGASGKILAVEVSGYGISKEVREKDKYGKAYKRSQVDAISYFIFGEQPTLPSQKDSWELPPEHTLSLFLIQTYIVALGGGDLAYFGWKAKLNALVKK